MEESSFKFAEPFVSKIVFNINEEFIDAEKLNIDNMFNVSVSRDTQENLAKVDLEIIVGQKKFTDSIPFYINMVISSMFFWDDIYDEDTLHLLLSKDAPSLLLSYARPLIANITNMSPFPAYNLPFYSFTED
ncbi:MAG: protein-export chaperone SecB [Acutalibacteraceae bacterium]